jgi:hypothetical protein
MKLHTHPQAGLPGQPEIAASVAGDVLTIDGIAYDLSAVPEGGEARPEGDHPFLGAIRREAGEIVATILWRYDAALAAPEQPRNPAHWIISVTDGPVPSPIIKRVPA